MGSLYGDLFAANLRAARARLGLSQSAVAARMQRLGFANWDGARVSRTERGKLHVWSGELLGLSLALECSLAEMVGSNTPPDLTVTFPDPRFEVSGVTVRNSALGYRDGSVGWDPDSEYPVISRPGNVYSAMAHDKSRYIIDAGPERLARYAG